MVDNGKYWNYYGQFIFGSIINDNTWWIYNDSMTCILIIYIYTYEFTIHGI